jgi:type 1 fimbria pilin
LKLLRLIFLLVLAWVSMPVLALDCINLSEPSKPVFSKQGNTTLATYKVTGTTTGSFPGRTTCKIEEVSLKGFDYALSVFGYTYNKYTFSFKNIKIGSTNCTLNSQTNNLILAIDMLGACNVSFEMVYPISGSYSGSNPLTDIIFRPELDIFGVSFPSQLPTRLVFGNPVTIPSEPARTCSLIHPDVVTMVSSKPSDFPSFSSLVEAGSFSVTLSCPPTTSARSGTPRLIFSYPSASLLNVCVATNQADPAVASPVTVVITRRINNNIICGDSAIGPSPDQNFASFNGSGAYTSTLDYKTLYFSQAANPAPGPFTASVTLQVSYP